MTGQQEKMLKDTQKYVESARMALISVQDNLEAAAEACKGTPMEDHLNSHWDAIEDLRFDLQKQFDEWKKRMKTGKGGEMPESWKEAV